MGLGLVHITIYMVASYMQFCCELDWISEARCVRVDYMCYVGQINIMIAAVFHSFMHYYFVEQLRYHIMRGR